MARESTRQTIPAGARSNPSELQLWSIRIVTVTSILSFYYYCTRLRRAPVTALGDIGSPFRIVAYPLLLLLPIRHLLSFIFRWTYPVSTVMAGIIHYLLLILEITLIGSFVVTLVKTSTSRPFDLVLCIITILTCILLAALSILWMERTVALVRWAMNSKSLRRSDLFRDCQCPETIENINNDSQTSRIQLLTGEPIWKIYYPGEAGLMISSRVLCACLLLLIIVIHSTNEIIINPIQEADVAPTVTTHQPPLNPLDTSNIVSGCYVGSALNIIATRLSTSPEVIQRAISVTPDPSYPASMSDYDCAPTILESFPQSILITCWPGEGPPWTQMLITVNYTMFDTRESIGEDSVHVLIGLKDTNNIQTIDQDLSQYIRYISYYTHPTLLVPGYNLLGQVTHYIRQIPSRWTLFGSGSMVPVVTVDRLFSDTSPSIPRSENISTLRLFCPTFNQERVTIQRSTTATIAGGFSSSGGLWTFINGVFAVIFGQSLLHILFGLKPLSFFGLVHRGFQREQLREALEKKYPDLLLKKKKSDHGLVDLLRDYVIDLDLVKRENKPPVDSEGAATGNDSEQSSAVPTSLPEDLENDCEDGILLKPRVSSG